MSDVQQRRKALGWSRKDLAERAKVDPRVLQLIELGLSEDDESKQRVSDVLDAADSAGTPNGSVS